MEWFPDLLGKYCLTKYTAVYEGIYRQVPMAFAESNVKAIGHKIFLFLFYSRYMRPGQDMIQV